MKRIITTVLCFCAVITLTAQAKAPYIELPPFILADYITARFAEKAPIMTAIFKAESGLNKDAVGYNCRYLINQDDGTQKIVSKPCKKEDRHKAWSVDCGIAQINYKGNECPPELLNPAISIDRAKEKLDTEGLDAWVAYTNGTYKKYLYK